MAMETAEQKAKRHDAAANIVAHALHANQAYPGTSSEEESLAKWKEHTLATHEDPDKFFGSNTAGANEYRDFCRKYDKDKRADALGLRKRPKSYKRRN